MKLTSILLLLIFSFNSFAQVKIGDNPNTINSNAVLELESTTKGLLIPRMTEAQRLAISFPAQGMLVYQTNNQSGFYYNSGSPITSLWQRLTNDFDQNWIKDGVNMVPHPNITGNIGIGTNSPDKAGLVVNKKIGAVNAMFGDNTTGVAIESSFPGIGLNSYYSGSRKYISNGYAGLIGLNPTNGDLSLWVSGASGTAGNTASLTEAVTINPNANVGIGTNDPQAKLHVNGSLRLQNGSQGSGKVLTSDASGNATWQAEGSNTPYM